MKRIKENPDGSLDYKAPEARVVVRVPDSLRDAFVASCKGQDTTASQELRRFMRDYVKKHGQGSLDL